MMTEDQFPVLSALIDREPLDADALALALEQPEGRQILVDFIRLREFVAAELEPAETVTLPALSPTRVSGSRLWRLAASALLPLMIGLGGGYWWHEREQRQPPTPTRVIQFVPGVDWK
jgi:hypothetical protein